MNHKNIVIKLVICTCVLHTLTGAIQAQRGWEAGGNLGISHYFGDLNNELDLYHPGGSIGVTGRYNFNKRLCLQMGVRYVFLRARDEWADNNFQQARNLSFRSHTGEVFLNMEFNFLEYVHGSVDAGYTPYILLGINVMRMQPQTDYIDENNERRWVNLRPLGTEGQIIGKEYNLFQPGIMYGVGMKIDFSRKWSLNVQLAGRYYFTDYIDDVSTIYPNKDQLLSTRGELAVQLSDRSKASEDFPAIGQEGRQRGDASTNDMYSTLSVGIMYYFAEIRCPKPSQYYWR